jgi:hypothetical protein
LMNDPLLKVLWAFAKPTADGLPRVKFKGTEFVFVGEDDRSDGAIATPEAYEAGDTSYAHLFEDGLIRRFQTVIGTKDDLEWL